MLIQNSRLNKSLTFSLQRDIKNLSKKKRAQINSQNNQIIHKQNLHLLRRMHQIEFRKIKNEEPFKVCSLNLRKRISEFNKIQSENQSIFKRIESQKTRYPTMMFQEQFKKAMEVSESMRKSRYKNTLKTQFQQNLSNKSIAYLPNVDDGYNIDRGTILSEIFSVEGISMMIQISKNNNFIYLMLQELQSQKNFKLRLINKTGNFLINLLKEKQLSMVSLIKKNKQTYIIAIPFSPFVRKYEFIELKKGKECFSKRASKTRTTKRFQEQY